MVYRIGRLVYTELRLKIYLVSFVREEGDVLRIKPSLPSTWDSFYVQLSIHTADYRITVKRAMTASITLDGKLIENYLIPLEKHGQHEIVVYVT